MATEKRLIDADALEQIFLDESGRLRKQIINDEVSCEEANYIRSFMPTIEWARKTVHRCATVDAVEVVRCKDCESYVNRECKNLVRHMTNPCSIYTLPNDFCSYGERRAEDG